MIIRPATADDWAEIWPFFRAIAAAGETYTYPRDISEGAARTLWMAGPPAHVIVAVDQDGAILGSAKMGPNQPGPGSHVATASFMVDPSRKRGGVGRALGNAMLDWVRDQGYHAIQFNAVVSTNAPAIALWQSLGFEIVGTVPEAFRHPAHGLVGLNIMYRRADLPNPS